MHGRYTVITTALHVTGHEIDIDNYDTLYVKIIIIIFYNRGDDIIKEITYQQRPNEKNESFLPH